MNPNKQSITPITWVEYSKYEKGILNHIEHICIKPECGQWFVYINYVSGNVFELNFKEEWEALDFVDGLRSRR